MLAKLRRSWQSLLLSQLQARIQRDPLIALIVKADLALAKLEVVLFGVTPLGDVAGSAHH